MGSVSNKGGRRRVSESFRFELPVVDRPMRLSARFGR